MWRVYAVWGFFFAGDALLFASTLTKIATGGYVPLLIATAAFTVLTTWKSGQRILNEKVAQASVPVDRFIKEVYKNPPIRVPGTAIYMTALHSVVPGALLNNLKHNKVLHERVIFFTIIPQEVPHVPPEKRVHVYGLGHDFFQLDLHNGFKDVPDVPAALRHCQIRGMDFDDIMHATFFLGHETVISTEMPSGIARWREQLFAWMKKNSHSAVEYFEIPMDRVVEIGGQYEI